jgi:hypothetical protein
VLPGPLGTGPPRLTPSSRPENAHAEVLTSYLPIGVLTGLFGFGLSIVPVASPDGSATGLARLDLSLEQLERRSLVEQRDVTTTNVGGLVVPK